MSYRARRIRRKRALGVVSLAVIASSRPHPTHMPLPWNTETPPLMLAPMQGVTNRALRQIYARSYRPDVLFTEFVRVRPRASSLIAKSDFTEALAVSEGIPLVVQVIGCADEGVVAATRELVARGVQHINVNMGCPFGRMTSVLAGGGMFRSPETVEPMLSELRTLVPGSLSVKTRTGLDNERQLFEILPAFERAGIDFLVVHSRTVKQKYKGSANHSITQELIGETKLPVIANGDIRSPEKAQSVLDQTRAAGLMLGRGAIGDPFLFRRIRENDRSPLDPTFEKRALAKHLLKVLEAYQELFCGEAQILSKFREILAHFEDPTLKRWGRKLSKNRQSSDVAGMLKTASMGG